MCKTLTNFEKVLTCFMIFEQNVDQLLKFNYDVLSRFLSLVEEEDLY